VETLPVTADIIGRYTRKDTELAQVYEFVSTGWPSKAPPNLQAYYSRRNELSLSQDCLIWGTRVIIPKSLRPQLLKEVHTGHVGIVRMKSVARSFVWWPGIDVENEPTAKRCSDCRETQNVPAMTVHKWKRPAGP
jgi:hypothetical protein